MHSLNCTSSPKYESKTINQMKNIDKNVSEIFGKNTKSKVTSSTSPNFKDSKLGFLAKSPHKFSNFEKRKDEKKDIPVPKRMKSDSLSPAKNLSDNIHTEQSTKFKPGCPKTYICKFCCRRFYTEEQLQQHSKIHGNKSSHICYLCNYQTVSFSALMNHYLKHSGSKERKLEKIFTKSKADFTNNPINISSKTKPTFSCSNCKLSFSVKSKLDAHKCPTGLSKDVYSCAYCGRVSSSVEEYRKCVQSHTETPFVCVHCKAKFQRKKQLDLHSESCKGNSKSNEDLKCDKCQAFACNSDKELKAHLKTCKNNIQNFVCKYCNSEFSVKKSLDEHLMQCKILCKEKSVVFKSETFQKKPRKYVKKKVKYTCSSCKAPFFLKSEYRRHEKNCSTIIPYDANESVSRTCSKCNEQVRIGKFAEHVKVCSNKLKTVDERTYVVENDVCSENTAEINILDDSVHESHVDQNDNVKEEHKIQTKHRVKSQTTLLPDEKHDKKNDVDVHKQTNAADDNHGARRSTRLVRRKSNFIDDEDEVVQRKKRKPVKIKIPKKPRVFMKPKFRRGKYTNESSKSFLCNICDFSFCSKSTLLRHKRMHSGNPWYTCKYCGKFFFRKDVYIRHEMNVHKDTTKTMFCCCYCKLCYKDGCSLKDHVMEVHKDSAFLPIRPRFFSKRNSNAVEIKQECKDIESENACNVNDMELDEKAAAKDTVSSFSTDPSYKCSVCFKMFETASETVIHMSTHSETDDMCTLKTVKNGVKHPPVNGSKLSKKCITKTAHSDSAKAVEKNENQIDASNGQGNSDIDELMLDENLINVDQYEKLECLLCLKSFSDKTLLEAHGKTAHKLVEWYQCLVCSASGPKQDMLEHMVSHMFKVGSFIVNSNSKNFDNIVPYLVQEKTSNLSDTDNLCETSQNTENEILSTDESELVSELELPPLREYGLCSCLNIRMPNTAKETSVHEDENSRTEGNPENLSNCFTLPNEMYSNQSETNIAEHNNICEVPKAFTNNELKLKPENLLEGKARNLENSGSVFSDTNKGNNNEKVETLFCDSSDINNEKLCTLNFSALQNEEKNQMGSLSILTLKESYRSKKELDTSVSSDEISNYEKPDLSENSQDTDKDKMTSSDSSSSEDEESVAGHSSNASEEEETKTVDIHPSSDDEKQSNSLSDDSSSDNDEMDDNSTNSSNASSSEEEETVVAPASDVSNSEEAKSGINVLPDPTFFKKETKTDKTPIFDIPSSKNKKFVSSDLVSSNKLSLDSKSEEANLINCSKVYSKSETLNVDKISASSVFSKESKGGNSTGPQQLSAVKDKKEAEFSASKVLYSGAVACDAGKFSALSVCSTENKGNSASPQLSSAIKDKKESEFNTPQVLYSGSVACDAGKFSALSVCSTENKGNSASPQLSSAIKDKKESEFNTPKVLYSGSVACDLGKLSPSSVCSIENKGSSTGSQLSSAVKDKKESEFNAPKVLYSGTAARDVGKLSASFVCPTEIEENSASLQLSSVVKNEKEAKFNSSSVLYSENVGCHVGKLSESSVCSYQIKGKGEGQQLSSKEKNSKKAEFNKPNTSLTGTSIAGHLYAPHPAEKKTDLFKCISFPPVGNHKDMHPSSLLHMTNKNVQSLEPTTSSVSSSLEGNTEAEFSLLNVLYPEEKEVETKEETLSNILFSQEKTVKNQSNVSSISTSSQVNDLLPNLQHSKSINDFESETFSQLRYLLQKPSKMEQPEKITIYPLSHTDSSVSQGNSNPFVKCVTSMENQTLFDSSFFLGNDFSLSNPNSISNSKTKFETHMPPNVNQNTCLKLDINQSRSEVSSNILPSPQSSKSSDKTENLFKQCTTQSPILDFSDLIQHSFENSSPSEENIFSYSVPVKTDLDNCREEIRTPDCTVIENFDPPSFDMDAKCSTCHAVLENSTQLASHKCLPTKTVKYVDPLFTYKPKSTIQAHDYFGNQKKVTSVITQNFQEKFSVPTIHKLTESYVGAKVMPSETETKRHCNSMSHQNVQIHPQTSSKCNKCQRTFTDIGELMKHSLSCLKPLFYRNTNAKDCMATTGTLHSLLSKEPVTSFSDFSFNSSVPVSTVTSGNTISHQNFENLKHSFDS